MFTFIITNMSIKYYVLGGPRYKPPVISRGSPRLHFIHYLFIMQLFVCCDRNKVQFNKLECSQCDEVTTRDISKKLESLHIT